MERWRRFGPASGNEPKPKGPYEAARHIPGVSGHELSLAANRRFSIPTLSKAIAELVDAQARLDIYQVWGDGSAVAADGVPLHRRVTAVPNKVEAFNGFPRIRRRRAVGKAAR
ncbi:Tn3 family transposase [Streptomyces niveiscabiei]|uniref:Tn3 family transposase n=1 Tax=Streptomyces niveiscabiei TaxID=164115 RepID=UPI0029A234CC|nr:Tn3 family transposase [Streptomyces niveiscabiei]MDX3388044.1 Tn3 family transposase [Streptomyces niveiscabiei]